MSAFIVDNKTINRALTYLKDNRNGSYTKRQITDKLGYDIENREDLDKLGRSMLMLNIDAVNQRYNEVNDSTALLEDYHFGYELCNNFQALKSLQCWHYQCAEGNVPESDLYIIMDVVINTWLYEIVSSLPAYENAEWR